MRGTDRVSREQLFPLVEGSVTRGNNFRVKGIQRRFENSLSLRGWCGNLECAAWEGSGDRKPYNLLRNIWMKCNREGYGACAGKWD